ncbi:Sec-independent protein translocase subunit TatA [Actinomyces howellii]|uniref:Sec-independent protein translocase protein TatA n=1 Tax=Actinomyces howellii TaxID=52771 RepID=A0A3S4V3B8_9ACTO|nr:Sec-independent protein translocase subunit TatA [Actinomyces howellii]VEG26122.1 twin arginine translocase protein A [Actinomyces howellii]
MKFSPTHIVVLLVVIILIFGAKRLPEIAGSVGKSMKVFKKEVKELREDDDAPAQIQQPQQGTYYTQPTQQGQVSPQQSPDGTAQQ